MPSALPRLYRQPLPAVSLVAALLLLSGCAGTTPHPYKEWPTSAQLVPNSQQDADRTPFAYSTPVDWRRYQSIIVDPVAVYGGADGQFEDLTDAEKTELADYMRSSFESALGKRFRIVHSPAPDTLRLALTLTGAKSNTAVVSTVTRFDLVGGPINAVQSIRGKEGVFIGSVSYAAEIRDAQDNRLVKAFVTKQYPNALNVGATFGRLAAARTGVDKGADALVEQLQ